MGELSGFKLLGILVLAGAVATGGLYYTVFKSGVTANCRGG